MTESSKRVVYQKDTVDLSSGEVIKTYTESVIGKEPDFIKLYLDDIAMLNNVPKRANGVLYELLAMMDYKNRIVLNSAIKQEIAEDLKIAVKTIDNTLNLLLKEGILIRRGTGLFIGNPNLFGKGEWKDIRSLRMSITYGKGGRVIETEIEKGDQVLQETLTPRRYKSTSIAVASIATCLGTSLFSIIQLL